MSTKTYTIGIRVVRSQGDYVVGRTGVIVDIDPVKGRAQVAWDKDPKSWVSFKSLALESIPYRIAPGYMSELKNRNGDPRYINPKYVKL